MNILNMLLQGYTSLSSPRTKSPGEFVVIKEEKADSTDNDYECVPLDLSVNGGRYSPGIRDSGTESDDSGGRCTPEGADCKAYKKSLMKRYCKFIIPLYFFFTKRENEFHSRINHRISRKIIKQLFTLIAISV